MVSRERQRGRHTYIFIRICGALGDELVAREVGIVAAADVVIADRFTQVLLRRIHVLDSFQSMVVPEHLQELLKLVRLQLQLDHRLLYFEQELCKLLL